MEAVRALGEGGRSDALPVVTSALLADSSIDVRCEAAQALGVLQDHQAVPALIEALRDSAGSVVMWSAQALGRLKAKDAVGPLEKLLCDPDWGKRAYAAEALAAVGHRVAVPGLLTAVADESGTIHKIAVEALAELVDASDVDALERLARQQPLFRRTRIRRLSRAALARPVMG